MARDTRGPVPYGHTNLRRFSLNPGHWHQARLMLGAQALVALAIGVAGLIGVYGLIPRGTGRAAVGLDFTPAFSWTLAAVGVAAAISLLHRRLAKVYSFTAGAVALLMVIVSAVGATHGDPGPLGFTVGAAVLYCAFFCANLATAMWLIPNHIEGPAWLDPAQVSDGEAVAPLGDEA
jgi:hypothetical protein